MLHNLLIFAASMGLVFGLLNDPALARAGSVDSLNSKLGEVQAPKDSLRDRLQRQREEAHDRSVAFETALEWAEYFEGHRQWDSAHICCDIAGRLALADNDFARVHLKSGQLWHRMNEDSLALKAFHHAMLLVQDSLDQVAILHGLHKSHKRMGKLDSSFHVLGEARGILVTMDEPKNLATVLNSIGTNHLHVGRYDSAAWYFTKSLDSYLELEDSYNSARCYDQLGSVSLSQGKAGEAEVFYGKALAVLAPEAPTRFVISVRLNRATALSDLGNSAESRTEIEKALLEAQEGKFPMLESIAMSNLAFLLNEAGKKDSARTLTGEALQLARRLGDKEGMAYAHFNLAEYEDRYPETKLMHLRKAQSIALDMQVTPLLVQIKESLYRAHRALGHADSALVYYIHMDSIQDSLRSRSVQENLAEIRGRFETKISAMENDRIKSELREKDLQLDLETSKQTLLWLGILGLVALVVVLGFLFVQRQKLQQRALEAQQLRLRQEQHNRQMAEDRLGHVTNMIVEKNRIIENLEAYSGSPEAQQKLIDSLAQNRDWAQFMVVFRSLYPEFLDRMEALPIKVSNNDYRIATLMKLKLSNKEMAEVLHISLSGVKAAKSRFKAKLDVQSFRELFESNSESGIKKM